MQYSPRQKALMARTIRHSGNPQAELVRQRAEEGSADAQFNYGRFCYEGSPR